MASYHLSSRIIGRSSNHSAVAKVCYICAEKIRDERTKKVHHYAGRRGVLATETLLPKNAPEKFRDRATLWNTVEATETRKNSQLAREIEIALPKELPLEEQKKLVREFCNKEFIDRGMIADTAIHDQRDGNGNFHAHVLLTTRSLTPDGFGKKNRDWNEKDLLKEWRKSWAEIQNRHLTENNILDRVDHRTLKEQGKTQVKTIHLGKHKWISKTQGTEPGPIKQAKAQQEDLENVRQRFTERCVRSFDAGSRIINRKETQFDIEGPTRKSNGIDREAGRPTGEEDQIVFPSIMVRSRSWAAHDLDVRRLRETIGALRAQIVKSINKRFLNEASKKQGHTIKRSPQKEPEGRGM